MAEIPLSIDVWVCPQCGHVDAYRVDEPCEGRYEDTPAQHPPARPLRARYVLAEPTDEMATAAFDARRSAEIDAALSGAAPVWATRLEIEKAALAAALAAPPHQQRPDGRSVRCGALESRSGCRHDFDSSHEETSSTPTRRDP